MRKSTEPRSLRASVGAALRRMRGPLPEVSEVPWSEWEDTVSALDAADSGSPATAEAVTVTDSDWATWLAALKPRRKK
jgi:hypothetical protein